MARTLIIKNADFSVNKVTTVTFTSVPCTGIALASDTITITGRQSVVVGYTVTPADTTDAVTWASSNTDIMTVAGGVITVVGVGTCTLTATCGSYSDTATVTVQMFADPEWYMQMYTINDSAHVLYWSGTDTLFVSLYGQGAQAGQYTIYNANDPTDNKPVLKLPGNTGRVKISVTTASTFYDAAYSRLFWMKDQSAGWSAADVAYYDSAETAYNIRSNTEKIYTVPEGIDAIAFYTRLSSAQSSAADAKAAIDASGFKIEFLPPATE